MINIFKSNGQALARIKQITPDAWIDLVQPTAGEIERVSQQTGIQISLFEKMLDENESPHVEKEDGATLIVVDVPVRDEDDDNEYQTYPLGVIIADKNNYVVTISTKNSTILKDFRRGKIKDFETAKKTRFLIQILTKIATEYVKILAAIYGEIERKEDQMGKKTSNDNLLDLLATEKTLVYFTTSLKENVMVLEKLSSGSVVPLYEGDTDLLEDALIENRQAVDMANIYHDILTSIKETYATVVSNNLNDVMKFLAGITVVLSAPTIIASFMGMNIAFGNIMDDPLAWLKILLFSIVVTALVYTWMRKKGRL